MISFSKKARRILLISLILLAFMTAVMPFSFGVQIVKAESVTAAVTAGTGPMAVAVNPVTNKIYMANYGGNNVTVIDGATNTTSTVPAGSSPRAVAVNSATNKIYVANQFSNNVTVIDGNNNSITTVAAGSWPSAVAVNPATNKIYVVNQTSNDITVIDGATNTTATVAAGTAPVAVAVNPATNKIYVANQFSNNVTVIDGATNTIATVVAGTNPQSVAVNPATNKIYVANLASNNVTVIDGADNSTATVAAGTHPVAVAVNPSANKIYVANLASNNVTVIDGADNSTAIVAAGTGPVAVAVNPSANKIYVVNRDSGNITVIDGTANTTVTMTAGTSPTGAAVNPVTNKIYVANYDSNNVTVIDGADNSTTSVAAGTGPMAVAVNPITNKIYVVNQASNDVTVIDGATNSTATMAAGTTPIAAAVNPATNKIYVVSSATNSVTVIDGTANTTTTVATGTTPQAVAVNPATNKIYVANNGSNDVTVIDGATNTTATVAAGTNPQSVAVNPATNKIYVANGGSANVTVIDGATNTTSTVTAGSNPYEVAVNLTTNKIYVVNHDSAKVTMIDGTTSTTATVAAGTNPQSVAVNPATNKIYVANWGNNDITVIDGATNTTATVLVGTGPMAVAVNPATDKVYVGNQGSNNVTVISEQAVQTSLITTSIMPLSQNITSNTTPSLQLSAASQLTPVAPPVQQLWCQVDSLEGQWAKTATTGSSCIYTCPTLTRGIHILYAFATDGQDGGAIGTPVIGNINSYAFTVVAEPSISTSTLPGGTTGSSYNTTLSAVGSASPYTWSASGLPAGLAINTATGEITGTPTAAGSSTVHVTVTDNSGTAVSKDLSLTIVLSDADKMAADKTALNIGFAAGDSTSSVTQNLNLPVTGAVYSSNIIWASSNPAVISDGGVVTRPAYASGDVNVTVTATVYNNGVSDNKAFGLTVLKLGQITHTVIFKDWDGTVLNTQTVNNGASATAPSNPARSGYSFTGWDKAFNNVISNLIVTAQYSLNSSTGGGSSSSGVSTSNYSASVSGTDAAGNAVPKTSLEVTVNQSMENASVKISSAQSDRIMSGGKAVVSIPSIPNVTSYTVGLPAESLSNTRGPGSLTIQTGTGSMMLPANMLAGIPGAAGKYAELSITSGDKSTLMEAAKAAVGDRPLVHLSLRIDGKETNWNNPAAPVRVSIPYAPSAAELAKPECIVIWYIDGSGNTVSVPNGHYDTAAGTVTFTTTHFSYFAVGYNPVSFTDVPAEAWYYKAVSFIASRKITTGTSKGNYCPDAKLTRGEFIVMLLNAYDIAPDTNVKDNFTDAGNTFYTDYLAAAKKLGISEGVGNNMFAPGKQITRQEMFTLLYNALKVIGRLPEGTAGKVLSEFSDAADMASWAKDTMTLMTKTGTISGSGGKLSPAATTTRAEMAQVLYSLLVK